MNVREIINATNGILLSGDENLEIIKNAFGKKFIFNCTGNVIKIL